MTISLNSALTGLRAAQRGFDTISNNIANATTPGYTRKILPLSSVVTGVNPLGVQAGELTRLVDKNLYRDMITQRADAQSIDMRAQFLLRIQDFHGEPGNTSTISAEMAKLQEAFNEFATSPNDQNLMSITLDQAVALADRIREFSEFITQLRNDAQDEMIVSVNEANSALAAIAKLNAQISTESASGRTTATLEDQRDEALKTLSQHIGLRFFDQESGRISVLTRQGEDLINSSANTLFFSPTTLLPGTFYPGGGSAGLFINSPSGIDLTQENIGGRLGALLELRDQTLPQYMAQLDEFAHKLALRFESQGLRLFTDDTGAVPADAPPAYVGFSSKIVVNSDILNDPTLLRTGTTGGTSLAGSSDVLRRVVDFAFGRDQYLRGLGTVDLTAAPTVFAAAGLAQSAVLVGTANLTLLDPLDSHVSIDAGDTFTIDIGGGPQTVTINGGDTATDLVNNINAALGGAFASLNSVGQLVIRTSTDITIADGIPPNDLQIAGLQALGLAAGTTVAQNPQFTVRVGQQAAVTVTIAPTDTAADLLATLNAVPGLTASLSAPGNFLQLVPTNGGDISLTDGRGNPLAAMGVSISSVAHAAFRQTGLGPDGLLNTELVGFSRLDQFSAGMISFHAEEHNAAVTQSEAENTFFNTLERRVLDQSGVDIDQELSELIKLQTAYAAAARVITASERLFDSLLQSVR